jgi:tetratricopeptide (TPR) repeat protein
VRRSVSQTAGFGCLLLTLTLVASPDPGHPTHLIALEQQIAVDPENLRLAAEYRQLLIADREFDRSIGLFERLARRKDSGANVHISLALAYVDKVPTSGDLRRLYLGRDAMNELTKALDRHPSVLAYLVRGVINLYYNNFIFKRIPRGIADLERALTLVTPDTPPALVAWVYRSLGDGLWRSEERAKARQAWATGASRIPGDGELRRRVQGTDREVNDMVGAALYAATRVDTSLRGMLR